MTPFFQVVTTVEEEEQATAMARSLLEERLVGCVQIAPCRSLYHWQGNIEEATEFVCTLKTREDLLDRLLQRLQSIHPYDVPEILAFSVDRGNPDYLAWLDGELAGRSEKQQG